jgi:hypothetical protein
MLHGCSGCSGYSCTNTFYIFYLFHVGILFVEHNGCQNQEHNAIETKNMLPYAVSIHRLAHMHPWYKVQWYNGTLYFRPSRAEALISILANI